MKVAADFCSRCFRSILPSTVVLSALSGGVWLDASRAVAQQPSAYAAPGAAPQPGSQPPGAAPQPGSQPTGTAPQPGSQPTGTAPQPGAQPTGTAPQTAPAQKSVAARRIEALCEMKNPTIDGEPLSLEKLLYGANAPSERYRRLAAYWDLSGKRAYCNLCVECANFATVCADRVQKRFEGATVPQETAAFLLASRLVAAQRRETARIDFVRAQHAFDGAFSSPAARRAAWVRRANEAQAQTQGQAQGANADAAQIAAKVGTPTSPVLYLPTAVPSADVYETRFDEMSRRRWLSNEATRLNVALPLLYEATRSRAEQAQHEWNNLNAAFNATETTETVLFAALDRYWAASREMLAAATRYNQAIAAYVAETVPGTLRGAALLATLNQRPSAADSSLKEGATSGNAPSGAGTGVGAATQTAPATARKTFADGPSVAAASYVAPAAVPAVAPVAPTSFVEPAPKPDLTPTPGARLEPAAAATPSTPAEPLPSTAAEPAPQPEPLPATAAEPAPQPEPLPATAVEPAPQPEPLPATAAEPAPKSEAETIVVTGYEVNDASDATRPTSPSTEPAAASDASDASEDAEPSTEPVAASYVGRIVRGQAPETPAAAPAETTQTVQKPQTPAPAESAQTAPTAQTPQNAQNPATPASAPSAARRRVDETVAVLFATPKAEPSPNGGAAGPLEVATSLRSVLERVPVSERAATVRAYWRLQEASARVAVESATSQALTQAFNELNAKAAGGADAAATANARLYLAAALGAQARVAEARIVKRDAQIALMRRTRWPLDQGWPIPSTQPFAGATYRLETPSTASPTLALEGAVIPENLKAIETLGSAFGAPATLCSFDVPPSSAADPLVPLATLEKKRESLLLFAELIVATNVAIAEYVASYPAGFVSTDRFVDALVGPGK